MIQIIKKTKLSRRFTCDMCDTEYITDEYSMTFVKSTYSEIKLIFKRTCPKCGSINSNHSSYWTNPKYGNGYLCGFDRWMNYRDDEDTDS